MATACTRPSRSGKVYLDEGHLPAGAVPDEVDIARRMATVQKTYSIDPLTETIEINPRSMDIDRAGFTTWADIFTGRQQLAMMAGVAGVKACRDAVQAAAMTQDHIKALLTMLGASIGKFADFCSTLCMFNYTGGRGVKNSFPQQSLPMVWDFAETTHSTGLQVPRSIPVDGRRHRYGPSSSNSARQRGFTAFRDASLDAASLISILRQILTQPLGFLHLLASLLFIPRAFANQATPKKARP
jgi:hypothetical protein